MIGVGSSIPSVALRNSVPARLSPGARLVFAGDSKFSGFSSPGARNIQLQTIDRLAGRVRLAVAGDQGIGGNTILQLTARIANTIAQQADISIIGIGHNSLGLGADTCIAQMQALQDALRAGLGSRYIIWTTVLPSVGGLYAADNLTLVAVNDWIMSLNGSDGGKTRSISFGYRSTDALLFDPLTMCYPEGSSPVRYIHPNARGASFTASVLAALIDSIVAAQTPSEALAIVSPQDGLGANLDPRYAFSGSGGTKTGATSPTGTVVDGMTVTNSTSCTVTCSVGSMLGYTAQVIDITGTASAEATVVISPPNSQGNRVPINGVAGDWFEALVGYRLSAASDENQPATGLQQHGRQMGGMAATRFSSGIYPNPDALVGQGPDTVLGPAVARTPPGLVRLATTNLATSAYEYGIRVSAGPVDIRLYLFAPICRRTELAAYAAPAYLGLDGVQGTAGRLGNSANATSLTIGTTYNFQPGVWSGGGLLLTQLLEISADGGASWAPVTGTTNAGYTWTAAGAGGNLIRQTVTATNSHGTVSAVWTGALT